MTLGASPRATAPTWCSPTRTSRCARPGSTGSPRGLSLPLRSLESGRAVSNDERIAHALRAVRLDRRGFVDDARIVHEQHRPRFVHGEALARSATRIEHARFAATYLPARDEHHRHEIHPVAVRSFWRRTADPVRRVDAELVGLDVPARYRLHLGKHLTNALQQLQPGVRAAHLRFDGLEP